LLRIRPEIAWENLDDRPGAFLGRVDIETDALLDGENTQTTVESMMSIPMVAESVNISSPENISSQQSPKKEGKIIKESGDIADLVMDLFPPMESPENSSIMEETSQVEESEQLAVALPIMEEATSQRKLEKSKESVVISGESFVEWLKAGIIGNTLTINNTSAKLHIVKGQLFLVTPGIFQMFLNSKGITNFTKKDIESLKTKYMINENLEEGQILQGVLDLYIVDEQNKKIYIVDYKTDKVFKEEYYRERYNVQIGIYEYSIFKQYGDNYEYNKIIYSTTMKKIIEI